jgi:hypothetical protein
MAGEVDDVLEPDRQDEVAEAVAQARRMAVGFRAPADETAEPMPAFAVPAPKGAAR